MKFLRIAIILLILLFIGAFILLTIREDPQALIIQFLKQQNSNWLWLILIISALTILSTLAGLPVLYFGIALGFFVNYFPALFVAWGINLLAVMFTFFMVRRIYYDYFANKYGNKKLIQKINSKVQKYGMWTVALSRSIYVIPTNLINFTFPLSKLTLKKYLVGTAIGLLPECLINTTTGYLLRHQVMLMDSPQQNFMKIIIVGAFLLLLLGTILIINYRRRKVKKTRINEIVPHLEKH